MIKTSAADPRLLQHTGPAVVFKDYNDMEARINRDDLDVDGGFRAGAAKRRSAGRSGHAGMGHAADSAKSCCRTGVRDMVRISDARMSGTAYGTCVLHVSPESCDRRSAGVGPRTAI